MASISASPGLRLAPAGTRHLAAAVRGSLAASLVAVALVLVARRIGGALVLSLGAWGLIAVAAAGGLAAAFVRWFGDGLPHAAPPAQYAARRTPYRRLIAGLAGFALPGLAAALLLAAVTLPGSSILGLVSAWFLLALGEAGAWMLLGRSQLRPSRRSPAPLESSLAEAELPPNLVQQVSRVADETGGESIHAVLRAALPAGEVQSALHLAFCPPLAAAPVLSAHALDVGAEVRITLAESFGARLEVRLPKTGPEDQVVLVEVLGFVKGQSVKGPSA